MKYQKIWKKIKRILRKDTNIENEKICRNRTFGKRTDSFYNPDTYRTNNSNNVGNGKSTSILSTRSTRRYGFSVDKTTMASEFLPLADANMYYGDDGKYYGADLNKFFVGDPFSEHGIICGTQAIVTADDTYLMSQESHLSAKDITGSSVEELYRRVSKNQPVVVWITI